MSRNAISLIIMLFIGAFAFASQIQAQAQFNISPSYLNFFGTQASPDTLVDTLLITNTGTGDLDWTASWTESWLEAVPASGTAPSLVEVRVTAESLTAGRYFGYITFESPQASNSPSRPPVYFYVSCEGRCGDANNDGAGGAVSDAIYVINYVFIPGSPAPRILACGDANGDCSVNISDAVYMISYVFLSGPAPGDCCLGGWEGQGGNCCQH
jgi:hypothetical protein